MIARILKFIGIASFCTSVLFAEASTGKESPFQSHRLWVGAEYLLWKIKNSPAPPPVVIQGPVSGPLLNEPTSKVVLGNEAVHTKWRSGGRFSFGYWIDTANRYAVEGIYFFLSSESNKKSVGSSGSSFSPQLGSPFINPFTNQEDVYYITNLNHFRGDATLKVENALQGAEINGLYALLTPSSIRFDFLLGLRYLNFFEKTTFFTDSPIYTLPEDVWNTKDIFAAVNNFYGGQVGLAFDYSYCNFFLNIRGKVALGADRSKLGIQGRFNTNEFNQVEGIGPALGFESGIFTQSTNSGKHRRTFFSLLTEGNVNLAYQFYDHFKVQLGYTILYVTKLLWGSNQFDRTINYTQSQALVFDQYATLDGPKRPRPLNRTNSFWVQGGSIGVVYTY